MTRAVALFAFFLSILSAFGQPRPVVLHAARLLDVETGKILTPGEVLVRGERIAEVGSSVTHPAGARPSIWAIARCCRA